MASYTSNFGLKLPEGTENVSRQDLNTNFQKVDAAFNTRVKNPQYSTGQPGMVLMSLGDGETEWTHEYSPSDQQVNYAVRAWLDDHPSATTTVQDGSITRIKLTEVLKYATDIGGYSISDAYNSTTGTYSVGDYCRRNGAIYRCTTAIASPEAWNGTHWQEVIITDELLAEIAKRSYADSAIGSGLEELASSGKYKDILSMAYITLEIYGITSTGASDNNNERAHIWLTSEQEALLLMFDDSLYAYNLCYKKNGSVVQYTSWNTTSPISIGSVDHDQVGVTFKRQTGGRIDGVLSSVLYSMRVVGNLATKEYVDESVINVDKTLEVEGSAADAKATGDIISELAENGYYEVQSSEISYQLTQGMVTITNTIASQNDNGYIYIPKNSVPTRLMFDSTKYKVNTGYVKNNEMISGTYSSWIVTSPVYITPPEDYDTLVVNVRKLSGNMSSSDLSGSLKGMIVNKIGELATKEYVLSHIPTSSLGRKVIYPDGFTSRIKPNIYYNGRYIADISVDDYKIAGGGEAWVATNGNDTTGDGTENNPYATITKALTTSAKTIYIKEGTYTQETHYATNVNLAGHNIIGIGTVIFQNNSSGHYVTANASCYIENIIFKHGSTSVNSAFSAVCSTTGQIVCFKKCTFRNGAANGLYVQGIDAILIECVAYGNKLDGFNYHDRTVSNVTYIPNVLEIDCVSYNNGSVESGNDSCNGSTAHDGVQIVRLNGEYYSCYGGVIAEIARTGEGDPKTKSVNFGVLAHESTGTGTYKASFWASSNAIMYLYNCMSYGGTYDISAIDDGKVVSWNLITGRDNPSVNVGSSATVIQH